MRENRRAKGSDPTLTPPRADTQLQSATAARTADTEPLGLSEAVMELLPVMLALCVAVPLADCSGATVMQRQVWRLR